MNIIVHRRDSLAARAALEGLEHHDVLGAAAQATAAARPTAREARMARLYKDQVAALPNPAPRRQSHAA